MQIVSNLGRLAPILGLAFFIGCGGSKADVSGTVTLDGNPLPNATVIFTPVSDGQGGGGRPAAAVTDAEGHYDLIYGRDSTGAVPGVYTVEIRTYREPNEDSEDPAEQAGAEEKVPAQYNANTELEETVEAGGGVIDFDLDSEGEIKLPPGAGGGGYGRGGYGG